MNKTIIQKLNASGEYETVWTFPDDLYDLDVTCEYFDLAKIEIPVLIEIEIKL